MNRKTDEKRNEKIDEKTNKIIDEKIGETANNKSVENANEKADGKANESASKSTKGQRKSAARPSDNRKIKLLTPKHIEDYLTIYLNAYPAYKDTGVEGRDKYRPKILHSMENDKNIHFYGLFEDGNLIAQMKIIDFSMNIFGEMMPATGLMALAVHPLHKKKGAAKDMVAFFEEYTKKTGAIVAMLLPFRMDFYKKMGYGYGSKMDEYRLATVNLPAADKTLLENVKILGWDQSDTVELLQCYNTFAQKNHGMVLKFEDEIRNITDDCQSTRVGYYEDNRLIGYMTFNFVCESETNYTLNRMEVSELVYHTPEALRGLLGFLRNQSDLAQTVVIRTGEPDFYHILDNAQDTSGNYIDYGFLQTNIGSVGTMYKIVDPVAFVNATSHRRVPAGSGVIEFQYEDEFNHCNKKLKIYLGMLGLLDPSTRDYACTWHVRKSEKPDVVIKCKLSELSSILMGSCSLRALIRLGSVTINNPNYTDELSRMLQPSQKPWTNTDY